MLFLLLIYHANISPLTKTMKRGSSSKFTVLRNYQNNCFLHPTLPPPTTWPDSISCQCGKWSHSDPWKQRVNSGISPQPGANYIPRRLARLGLTNNSLHMSKQHSLLESPRAWQTLPLHVLQNILSEEVCRRQQSAVCLLTHYAKCPLNIPEKHMTTKCKTGSFTLLDSIRFTFLAALKCHRSLGRAWGC